MNRFFLLLLILIPWRMNAAQGPADGSAAISPVFAGNLLSFTKNPVGIEVRTDNALILAEWFSPTIIRFSSGRERPVREQSYAVIARPVPVNFTVKEEESAVVMLSDSLKITLNRTPFRISVHTVGGKLLSEDYGPLGTVWLGQQATVCRRLFEDEKFVGLGEKTGNLNKRGSSFQNWNSDVPAYLTNQDPLYQSIPFFMGFHDEVVYGIFLDNTSRTRFNFGASTDEKFSSFSISSGELTWYFFGATTPTAILKDYTWLTGRMNMPPLWSLGYQQCRWSYYPDSEVLSVAQSFRDRKIPCDVIYLDIDYMDSYKIFTWNKQRFGDPEGMISRLNSMGFHLATIVDPGIKIEKGYFAYDEGVSKSYFAKYPDGSFYTGNVWPGRCHFPDFTDEAVRSWWGNCFSRLVTPGVEGFWNDMNEPSAWGQDIPDFVMFSNEGKGACMDRMHNVYGLCMAKATFEGTRKLMNGKRPFILTRAGYAGIQRYSAVWTGDNEASDEHMLLSARMVTGLGLSGVSFTGPDLGGFIGNPSKELYERWLSLGVYTPFFRNHSAWDTKSKEPWSFGRDAENFSRRMISQRYRLMPYIYSAFYESHKTGIPVARSLVLNYYHEEKVWWWSYQNQYLFGQNLLVAPVSCSQNFARVYLPPGGWYRFGSDEFFEGNKEVLVSAPLDDLPVFARASSFIPMQSVVQSTSEKPSDTLDIHFYSGREKGSYDYYEDDGLTYNYEDDKFFLRTLDWLPGESAIMLGKAKGKSSSRFLMARIILHGVEGTLKADDGAGREITLNQSAGNKLSVLVPWNGQELKIRLLQK